MAKESQNTRERILQATYELLTEGDPNVSMGGVAERADLSRQGVYLHFSSRTELLLELVRWVDERLGLGERLRAARNLEDPVERAVALARAAARYEAEIQDIALAIDIARHDDEAAAAAWDDRMSGRRAEWRRIFADIDEASRLPSGWTPKRAAEAFWSASSPAAYRQLVEECGWSAEEYEEWVVHILRTTLITRDQ